MAILLWAFPRERDRASKSDTASVSSMRAMLRLFSTETAVDLANAAQGGRVMDVENTDLERRVLAHEQILQVLIAHMAEAEPKFLDRLQQIFTKHHTLGADEQDYTGTAAYAEQFIQQVVRLRDKGRCS
jgi:hypothetical protein